MPVNTPLVAFGTVVIIGGISFLCFLAFESFANADIFRDEDAATAALLGIIIILAGIFLSAFGLHIV